MRTARTQQRGNRSGGFTLVEMLVSVTLVLLMMTIFAGIFHSVTGSMSKMKGFAENDQKARMLDTILRTDIVNRSMTKVYPWMPGSSGAAGINAPPYSVNEGQLRRGYFHLSEGQPDDDTDDVLQLTIDLDGSRNQRDLPGDTTPLSARAVQLTRPGLVNSNLLANQNQPVFDDARAIFDAAVPLNKLRTDRTTTSVAAEVVYFLRRGVLYRRVLPLRNSDRQPKEGTTNNDMIVGTYSANNVHVDETASYTVGTPPTRPVSPLVGAGNYYNDFDLAAYFDPAAGQIRFHCIESLGTADTAEFSSLCDPRKRFGFYPEVAFANWPTNPRMGLPMSVDAGGRWFGRFTHRETSAHVVGARFEYPGSLSTNPYAQVATGALQLNTVFPGDVGGVMSLAGTDGNPNTTDDVPLDGPRAGEDILLTNVLGFDVKILDDDLLPPSYVDLGHAGQTDPLGSGRRRGYYQHSRNLNPRFGPVAVFGLGVPAQKGADGEWGRAGVDDDGDGTDDNITERGWPGSDDPWNRVYDTWSPSTELPTLNPGDGRHLCGLAPFRAIDIDAAWFGADGKPGVAGTDDDNDGVTDNLTELWWDDIATPFDAGSPTSLGDEDTATNADTDDRTPRQLAFAAGRRGQYFSNSSAARELGPDGTPGNWSQLDGNPPTTPANDNLDDDEKVGLLRKRINTFYDLGFPSDNDDAANWSANSKVTIRPLLAIQIRVRYLDPTSNQIRELTIQQRLAEQDKEDYEN